MERYEMSDLWSTFTSRTAILRILTLAILGVWAFTTVMDVRSSLWGIEVTAPFEEGRFIEIVTSSIPQILGIAICIFLGTRIRPTSFKQRIFYVFLIVFGGAMIALDTWLGFLYYRALLGEAYQTLAFWPMPADPLTREIWYQVMLRAVVRDLLLSEILIALVAFFLGIAQSEGVTILPRPDLSRFNMPERPAFLTRSGQPNPSSPAAPPTGQAAGGFRRRTRPTTGQVSVPSTPRAEEAARNGPMINGQRLPMGTQTSMFSMVDEDDE